MAERFIELPQLAQGDAKVAVSVGKIRPELQGAAQRLDGFGGLAQPLQDDAKVAQRFGEVRPQPQGHPAAAQRPVQLPKCPVSFGQVGVKCRHVGPQSHRPADQVHRPLVFALLMRQNAEKMQSVGVLSFLRQHLLIQPSRPRQLALLVQFHGSSQKVLHWTNRSTGAQEPINLPATRGGSAN